MFRRKKETEDEIRPLAPDHDSASDTPRVPSRPATAAVAPSAPAVPATLPARSGAAGVPLARPAGGVPARAAPPDAEGKKLIVGREIMLSGKITSCDKLVVEGRVEADLSETRAIEIAEMGYFKGNAEIDQAEIAGRFEGNITVRQRLFIRATGKVTGTIRYGTVEIEAGGEISGDVQVSAAAARTE